MDIMEMCTGHFHGAYMLRNEDGKADELLLD